MNGLLLIIIVIFLIFAIRGWRRGLLQVLFSLVSVIVLIALAVWLAPHITSFFVGAGDDGGVLGAAGGRLLTILIAAIAAFVIVRLIARALKLVNRIPVLGKINRFLGLLAGLAEGLLVVWIVMTGIRLFLLLHPDAAVGGTIAGDTLLSYLYDNNPLSVPAFLPFAEGENSFLPH